MVRDRGTVKPSALGFKRCLREREHSLSGLTAVTRRGTVKPSAREGLASSSACESLSPDPALGSAGASAAFRTDGRRLHGRGDPPLMAARRIAAMPANLRLSLRASGGVPPLLCLPLFGGTSLGLRAPSDRKHRRASTDKGILPSWRRGQLVNWSTGQLVNWSTGQLINWSTDQLVN